MKFYCLLLVQLIVLSVFAQTEIEINLVSSTQYEGEDLSFEFLDIPIYMNITNTGSETANLRWEFFAIDGNQCMDAWDMLVCDNNNCYTPAITSNIDPDIGIDIPSVIAAGETVEYIFHVQPQTIAGCCEIGIDFSTVEDQETIIASINLPISINDPNCENVSNSIADLDVSQNFSVYPSMSNGHIFVQNKAQYFSGINVFSSTGVLLLSQDLTQDLTELDLTELDLSELQSGVYYLQGFNSNYTHTVPLFIMN
jgi:hypothetical protein